jgi:hypothetical protein
MSDHHDARVTQADLKAAQPAGDALDHEARRIAAHTASDVEAASMSNLIGPSSLIVPTPRDLADRDRAAHVDRMARLAASARDNR